MTKITCAEVTCRHNDDNNVCQAKRVSLSAHNIATVNEGRQDFWRCQQYEMDERSKEILAFFMNKE